MPETGSFLCDGCGRKYALTPAVAGRKVRCKCGAIIAIPAAPPAESYDAPPLDDDLYGFADDPAAAPAEPLKPIQPVQPIAAPVAAAQAAGGSGRKNAPAPSIAGYSASAPTVVKYDNSNENRRGLMLGVVGLLLIGVLIGAFSLISKSKPAATAAGPDAEILKLMKEEGTEEAKAFVEAHRSRMIMGMTRESSLGYVDRLYDRGAVQVLAFANGIVTRSLVIELPDDAGKREALITYANQWHEEMGIEPITDQGQRYLRLMMRI